MIIDPDGTTYALDFEDNGLTADQFTAHAKKISSIYNSGQGYIEITPTSVLSFTKKKLSYKGTKLGAYRVSDQCSKIELVHKPSGNESTPIGICNIEHRHNNIIALKQGKETVIYLRRDPKNPFFVGNGQ